MNDPEAEYHAQELAKHCRVCGKRFARGDRQLHKTHTTPKTLITTCYNVDIDNDNDKTHPPEVCHACISQMRRLKTAQGSRTNAAVFEWASHTDEQCCICEHFRTTLRGGRPKKQQPVGRQSGELTSHTLTALQDVAGPCRARGISPSRLVSSSLSPTHVTCVLCQAIVDAPVQLSCDNLVCHPCIKEHVLNNSHTCPGCTETLESGHFSKCTALVLTVIGHLHIKCKFQCPYPVILESLLQHEATCPGLTHQDLPRWSLMGCYSWRGDGSSSNRAPFS